MSDTFSKSIVLSLAAHFALVIALVFRAVFIPDEAIDLREAIRVDVVGLPEKEQQLPEPTPEPAKPTPPPPPSGEAAAKPELVKAKPQPPKTPTVDLSKNKKVDVAKMQKKALQEIKAMSALDKIREEVSNQPAKPKQVKGNSISAGNSLTGLEKIDFDRYFSELEGKVRQNWSLPQWLIDAGFRAQALVMIDETGAIKEKKIIKSSGNAEFDQRVLETLQNSGPFPAPPERLRDVLSAKGIIFNFPQRGTDT
jgi:colicin import membrane protein